MANEILNADEITYLIHNIRCLNNEMECVDITNCTDEEITDLSEHIGALVVKIRNYKKRGQK